MSSKYNIRLAKNTENACELQSISILPALQHPKAYSHITQSQTTQIITYIKHQT